MKVEYIKNLFNFTCDSDIVPLELRLKLYNRIIHKNNIIKFFNLVQKQEKLILYFDQFAQCKSSNYGGYNPYHSP